MIVCAFCALINGFSDFKPDPKVYLYSVTDPCFMNTVFPYGLNLIERGGADISHDFIVNPTIDVWNDIFGCNDTLNDTLNGKYNDVSIDECHIRTYLDVNDYDDIIRLINNNISTITEKTVTGVINSTLYSDYHSMIPHHLPCDKRIISSLLDM